MPKQLVYIDPQTGTHHYSDGSVERPDGSVYNPPTGPEHSPLGGGTAGMSAVDQYNTMLGNRDQRRGGAYAAGGQVNPYTPPAGPYGSSNPGQDQMELEIANRYGPHTGIPHPMTVRPGVSSNPAYGGETVVNPRTGRKTGKVTDPTSPHYGAEYDTGTHTYDPVSKLVRKAANVGENKLEVNEEDKNTPEAMNARLERPYADAAVNQVNNSGTPAENAIRAAGGSAQPASTTHPQYPRMSASLNTPISEFGIEDGTEHLQKLYDKQRQLMEQGQNSQNSAAARAIRRRAVELDDHISKLKKSAALKTPEQLEADGERPLPPIKPPQYVGPLETDWEQGMHSFDKDGSGGLNQEELRAWRKWKQIGQGKRPDHRGNIGGEGHPNFTKHGSSTQMTPPGMMPGYTIGGGVDTTGTQHQDTGGVNPDAPLFGAGMGFGTPPLGAPDDPSVSGQDMMQQFPPGMPNPTPDARLETNYGVDPNAGRLAPIQSPAEQAGMTDSVSAPVGEVSGRTAQEKADILLKEIRRSDTPVNYQELIANPNVPADVKEILVEMAIMDADGDGKVGVLERMRAARNRRDNPTAAMSQATTPGAAPMAGMMGAIQQNRRRRRQ
jgi:hypothetical protein